MFLSTKKIVMHYVRKSRLGIEHPYSKIKTLVVLKCDGCSNTFEREQGKMNYRRANIGYQHVCPNCNQKQFAQSRGVESRRLWNLPVDSDIKINKL
jgi:DNA-directed RNA polymerase subunit RPC12/RpoP